SLFRLCSGVGFFLVGRLHRPDPARGLDTAPDPLSPPRNLGKTVPSIASSGGKSDGASGDGETTRAGARDPDRRRSLLGRGRRAVPISAAMPAEGNDVGIQGGVGRCRTPGDRPGHGRLPGPALSPGVPHLRLSMIVLAGIGFQGMLDRRPQYSRITRVVALSLAAVAVALAVLTEMMLVDPEAVRSVSRMVSLQATSTTAV